MAVLKKKPKATPTSSKAEVDVLKARIDDLKLQIANREKANQATVDALELSGIELTRATERVVELNAACDEMVNKFDELKAEKTNLDKVHERIKTDALQMIEIETRDRPKELVVPAMVNKARAVRACRDIEVLDSCSNVRGVVERLRLFIEDHCK